MTALEILKKFQNEIQTAIPDYIDLDEAIKELKDMQKDIHIITDDRRTLTDFVFTNCNECINKVDNHFTETCLSCKRYYSCYFEKKETK